MKKVSPIIQSSLLWHITTEAGMEVLGRQDSILPKSFLHRGHSLWSIILRKVFSIVVPKRKCNILTNSCLGRSQNESSCYNNCQTVSLKQNSNEDKSSI